MKQLTGMFPPDNIVMLDVPRPPEGLIEALMELGGAVCLVSDVMDALGLTGVLPASLLRPVIAGRTIAGPALTIRKVRLNENERDSSVQRRGDIEAHNLTTPGDVLVIEGCSDVSNMGGLSALTGKRQGSRGAVIWGGCRDIAELREIDYPVWSTAVTPITGVGRVESEIINGDVQIGPFMVRCGDIIVADDDGVCIVPQERAVEVVERARLRAAADERRARLIRNGVPIVDLARS
jgi:4-hydroxy-4-methyl-2-oxoglutarate aldolase